MSDAPTEPVVAVTYLYDRVKEFFEEEDLGTSFVFGWGKAWEQLNEGRGGGNRIVWEPGDATGGLGNIVAPRRIGGNPRQLANVQETFTVTIWGYDRTNKHDHRAQYIATRMLYDAWYRAMHHVGHGTFTIVSQTWVEPARLSNYGAAIQVVCTVRAPIIDVTFPSLTSESGSDGGPGVGTGITVKAEFPSGDETFTTIDIEPTSTDDEPEDSDP